MSIFANSTGLMDETKLVLPSGTSATGNRSAKTVSEPNQLGVPETAEMKSRVLERTSAYNSLDRPSDALLKLSSSKSVSGNTSGERESNHQSKNERDQVRRNSSIRSRILVQTL